MSIELHYHEREFTYLLKESSYLQFVRFEVGAGLLSGLMSGLMLLFKASIIECKGQLETERKAVVGERLYVMKLQREYCAGDQRKAMYGLSKIRSFS